MQAILLYGTETWVLTAPMLVTLKVVHVGLTRGIARIQPQRLVYGVWVHLHLADVLHKVGLQMGETYIDIWKERVAY